MRSTMSARLISNSRFSRQEAMELHRNLQKHATSSSTSSSSSQVWIPSYLDKFCKPIPLSTSISSRYLRPMKLSELEHDCWHQGRVLQGRLVAPAFNFRNLGATVLEDEDGNAARVFVSYVLCAHSTREEVARAFRENAEVRIKEPCLVTRNPLVDGPFLWVANPACLEVVSHFAKKNFEPENARNLAKEEFSKDNFGAAIELYTNLLNVDKEDCLALAGRAEAWLKLRKCRNALDDAEHVLKLQPSHTSCLRIKVEALWGMQQYRSAYNFSKESLATIPELEAFHTKALVYKDQSEDEKYDLSNFYIEGLKRDSVPDCAEFVGPIEVRLSPGCGRGLFFTSNVRKGDLLLVSNAVARIPMNDEIKEKISRGDSSDLLSKVVEACLASKRTLSQVYSMAEVSRGLYTGVSGDAKISKGAPSIELFKPNSRSSEEQEDMVFDVVKLQNILDTSTEIGLRDDYSDDFVGFWSLPAFINHSCLPNVCVRKFGKSCFVFAARDMEAGKELLRSYGHSLHPAKGRRNRGSFQCKCERCVLEQRLGEDLDDICERYFREVLAKGMYDRSAEIVSELEDLLDEVTLSRKEKMWLRAMFPAAYATCFAGFVQKRGLKLPLADEMIESLHETAPGDLITLLLMSSFKGNATSRGLGLLMEECKAAYGRTSPEVANAILGHLESGRIGGSM